MFNMFNGRFSDSHQPRSSTQKMDVLTFKDKNTRVDSELTESCLMLLDVAWRILVFMVFLPLLCKIQLKRRWSTLQLSGHHRIQDPTKLVDVRRSRGAMPQLYAYRWEFEMIDHIDQPIWRVWVWKQNHHNQLHLQHRLQPVLAATHEFSRPTVPQKCAHPWQSHRPLTPLA